MTELIGMIPVPDEVSPEEVQRWRPSLLEAIAVGQAEGRQQAVSATANAILKRLVHYTDDAHLPIDLIRDIVRASADRVAGLNASESPPIESRIASEPWDASESGQPPESES